MQKISMDKQYKTRGGKNVRVLCLDMKNTAYPVAAVLTRTDANTHEEYEAIEAFTAEGMWLVNEESQNDLIEVKPFVFIPEVGRKYKDTDGFVYTVLLTNVQGAYPVMLGFEGEDGYDETLHVNLDGELSLGGGCIFVEEVKG